MSDKEIKKEVIVKGETVGKVYSGGYREYIIFDPVEPICGYSCPVLFVDDDLDLVEIRALLDRLGLPPLNGNSEREFSLRKEHKRRIRKYLEIYLYDNPEEAYRWYQEDFAKSTKADQKVWAVRRKCDDYVFVQSLSDEGAHSARCNYEDFYGCLDEATMEVCMVKFTTSPIKQI